MASDAAEAQAERMFYSGADELILNHMDHGVPILVGDEAVENAEWALKYEIALALDAAYARGRAEALEDAAKALLDAEITVDVSEDLVAVVEAVVAECVRAGVAAIEALAKGGAPYAGPRPVPTEEDRGV